MVPEGARGAGGGGPEETHTQLNQRAPTAIEVRELTGPNCCFIAICLQYPSWSALPLFVCLSIHLPTSYPVEGPGEAIGLDVSSWAQGLVHWHISAAPPGVKRQWPQAT